MGVSAFKWMKYIYREIDQSAIDNHVLLCLETVVPDLELQSAEQPTL